MVVLFCSSVKRTYRGTSGSRLCWVSQSDDGVRAWTGAYRSAGIFTRGMRELDNNIAPPWRAVLRIV
jgi:hypothetical protein